MKSVVLLSAGLHPASGRPAPVDVEMQAIRLALALGAPPDGLHVGGHIDHVRDALGHGIARLLVLDAGDSQTGDPLGPLLDHLRGAPPDLVLTGRRGQGGSDSGLLPYRLANGLGWPILADVAALERVGDGLRAQQALPRGARRVVTLALPCVVTVHPAAPAALPFRQAGLRGEVIRLPAAAMSQCAAVEQRPYRMRPKVMDRAQTASRILRDITPEQAAEAVLEELRRLKVVSER